MWFIPSLQTTISGKDLSLICQKTSRAAQEPQVEDGYSLWCSLAIRCPVQGSQSSTCLPLRSLHLQLEFACQFKSSHSRHWTASRPRFSNSAASNHDSSARYLEQRSCHRCHPNHYSNSLLLDHPDCSGSLYVHLQLSWSSYFSIPVVFMPNFEFQVDSQFAGFFSFLRFWMRFWICSLTLNFLENRGNGNCQRVPLRPFGLRRVAGSLVVHESAVWRRRRPHSCFSNSSWILVLPAFAASAVDFPFLLILRTNCLWIHDCSSHGCSLWAPLFSNWPWYPPLYLDKPFSGRPCFASLKHHTMNDLTSSFVLCRFQSRTRHVALVDPCMNFGLHHRHSWAFGCSTRTLRLIPAFVAPHCSLKCG